MLFWAFWKILSFAHSSIQFLSVEWICPFPIYNRILHWEHVLNVILSKILTSNLYTHRLVSSFFFFPLKCRLKIFVPIAFLAFTISVPVNWTNNTLEHSTLTYSDLDKLSISNIPTGSCRYTRLITFVLLSFCFISTFFFLKKEISVVNYELCWVILKPLKDWICYLMFAFLWKKYQLKWRVSSNNKGLGQLFNQMILSMFPSLLKKEVGYFFVKLCSISYVAIPARTLR